MKNTVFYILLMLVLNTPIFCQGNVAFLEVASGLSRPVVITNAGDGSERLFIVEKKGVIKLVKNAATMEIEVVPFLDIESRVDDSSGEEGLLGLAFHPDFKTNGYFYVNYIKNNSPLDSTRISRFTVDPSNPDVALPNTEVVLLNYAQPFGNHNGGDLQFGPDGYLYIASGDGGWFGDPDDNGQDENTLLGSILRIDVNNLANIVPPSNPFGNENWLIGLRNPWRFSFDRLTGEMYIADVGQDAREEVNVVPAGVGGLNLGWNCREGFIPYNGGCAGTFHEPIFDYPHSLGNSITGGYVYRGSRFTSFQGWYFFIDYNTSRFWQTNGTTQVGLQSVTKVINNIFSVSSFGESESGELYAVTYSSNGKVYRLIDLDDCNLTENISNVTQLDNWAQESITSDAIITQDNVKFGALTIVLEPEFEVGQNVNFETLSGICGAK